MQFKNIQKNMARCLTQKYLFFPLRSVSFLQDVKFTIGQGQFSFMSQGCFIFFKDGNIGDRISKYEIKFRCIKESENMTLLSLKIQDSVDNSFQQFMLDSHHLVCLTPIAKNLTTPKTMAVLHSSLPTTTASTLEQFS